MTLVIENWLAVPGFEGAYEVSSLGAVRSLPRVVAEPRGSRRLRGRVLRAHPDSLGYPAVTLRHAGREERWRVHQLVMHVFIGSQCPGTVVRHLNDDKLDNRLSNLAYGTQGDNIRDIVRNGNNHNAKKTECKRGHPLSGDNLGATPTGGRRCKRCAAEYKRARYATA